MAFLKRAISVFTLFAFCFGSGLVVGQAPQVPQMPPEIQRIFQKVQSGQQPTPEEQKTLQDWARSTSGQPAGARGSQRDITPGGSKGTVPGLSAADSLAALGACPKPATSQRLFSRPPTRETFIIQIKGAAQLYGAKAAKARPEIDKILRTAQSDRDGSNLGAMLAAMGAGSAGVYATTWSALRNPDDPVTANNLGVLLKGMKDYPRALQALLYADKLLPEMPVTITNLGWVYYDLGDTAKARTLFERAIALNPDAASAHMGLGLLAECGGDNKAAAKELRQSLDNGSSSLATTALDMADAAAAKSDDPNNGARPINHGPTSPRAPSAAEEDLSLPDPPVSSDVSEMAAAAKALAKMYSDSGIETFRVGQEMRDKAPAYQEAVKQSGSTTLMFGNSGVAYKDYDLEEFLLRDLHRIFITNKVKPAYNDFHKEASDLSQAFLKEFNALVQRTVDRARACGRDNACAKQVEYTFCKQGKQLAEAFHPRFFKAWTKYWNAAKPALIDYHDFTNSALGYLRNPVRNDYRNLTREYDILSEYQTAFTWPMQWSGLMAGAWRGECKVPVEESPAKGKANVKKKRADKCPFPPVFVGIGVLSIEFDCEKFKIQGGEGIIGSLEVDMARHEVHMWVGVGVSAKIGAQIGAVDVTLLKAEAKAGVRVDVAEGHYKDAAMDASLGLQVAAFKGKLRADIALEGGPHLEGGFKFGGGIK